jgi:hypothetical protein
LFKHSDGHVYAADAALKLLGRVILPEQASWVSVDDQGRILVHDGARLLVAQSWEDAAQPNGFVPVLDIPNVKAMDGAALMPIGGHIHISAVCGKLAVIGHILRLRHTLSVGRYELDNIAPIDCYCNQVVVDLDDVVRGITQLPLIDIPEPLVADHLPLFKIGDFAIVGLPVSFVQQNDALLAMHRGGNGAEK